MSVILVDIEDTFDQWRKKTNNISIGIGDLKYINSGDSTVIRAVNRNFTNIGTLSSLSTTLNETLVDAINEIDYNTDINTITIGNLIDLDTTDKSSIVNAINEVDEQVGNLTSLTTDAKSNLVVAVNEVDGHVDINTTNIGNMGNLTNGPTLVNGIEYNLSEINDINNVIGDQADFPFNSSPISDNLDNIWSEIQIIDAKIGDDTLNTTASYTTGAINELYATGSLVGDLTTLTTEDQSTIVAAINEINTNMSMVSVTTGDLLMLDTGVKTDLVSAINEVATNTVAMALILG